MLIARAHAAPPRPSKSARGLALLASENLADEIFELLDGCDCAEGMHGVLLAAGWVLESFEARSSSLPPNAAQPVSETIERVDAMVRSYYVHVGLPPLPPSTHKKPYGLDAMVAIRGEFPDAKIIILTTYGNDAPGALKLGTGLTKGLLGRSVRYTPGIKRLANQDLSLSGRCAHRDRSRITPYTRLDSRHGQRRSRR